jgi:SagB-type dehydrogenase family enzyme
MTNFRDRHPLAWTYHRNTSRWPFNMHDLNPHTREVAPFKEDPSVATIELPPPSLPAMPLAETIAGRASCRRFAEEPMTLGQLGDLLHTGYGTIGVSDFLGEFLERPVPSGGGLYPLELYVLAQRVMGLVGGGYHYVPVTHVLEVIQPSPLPSLLATEMFLGQPYLAEASAIIVMAAVVERSLWKYEDRGYRYILLEAGHVGQNLSLGATALGLGCLSLGGFFDDDIAGLLRLDIEAELVLYGIAVGPTSSSSRGQNRQAAATDTAFRRY